MAFKQEVNVPLLLTIGIVSGILVVVLIIGTQAWYQSEEQAEMAAKAQEFPNTALIDLKDKQEENIQQYRMLDKDRKIIAIPISESMKIMVQTQNKFPATQPAGR